MQFAQGTKLSGIDPESGDTVKLFHPRQNEWDDHFNFDGINIVGLTPCGRATVRVLNMNDDDRLELRIEQP